VSTVWIAALVASVFSVAAAAEQTTSLEFDNVWVRAMPPFQPNSAGYLTLTNRGDNAIAIVSASSNVAKSVELHTTRKVDGMVRMEKLQGLAVAPGERVELVPGGKHLMLLGLAFRLVPGDDVQICLQLASGDEACTDAEVRTSGDEPDAQDHQHHHSTE
jgi:copper(I)-binding protein